jgi:hypothetical protein
MRMQTRFAAKVKETPRSPGARSLGQEAQLRLDRFPVR